MREKYPSAYEFEEPIQIKRLSKLCAAVINNAYCCIIGTAPIYAQGKYRLKMLENQKLVALQWLNSEDDYPFSLEWCSEVMGVDADIIRTAIKKKIDNNEIRKRRWRP